MLCRCRPSHCLLRQTHPLCERGSVTSVCCSFFRHQSVAYSDTRCLPRPLSPLLWLTKNRLQCVIDVRAGRCRGVRCDELGATVNVDVILVVVMLLPALLRPTGGHTSFWANLAGILPHSGVSGNGLAPGGTPALLDVDVRKNRVEYFPVSRRIQTLQRVLRSKNQRTWLRQGSCRE